MKLPGDAALATLLIDGSEEELKAYGELCDVRETLQAFPATLRRIYWRLHGKSFFSPGFEDIFDSWQRRYGPVRKAIFLLLWLLPQTDFRHTGLLCAALWPVRDRLLATQEAAFDERLAPLLLALDEDQARSLSEDARRWIRWRLERPSSPEFRVAALLTLASAGDRGVASRAAMLLRHSDERVRMAASEALRATKTK